jgi:multiple sugar transport system permease protein
MAEFTPKIQMKKYFRWPSFRYRHRYLIGYIFIIPWFLSFLWFDVIPFFLNFYLSLTNYSVGPIGSAKWIGVENYVSVFTNDSIFLKSLGNTLYFAFGAVPIGLLFAFLIALLLNNRIRGLGIFRTAFYIPSLVPAVATSIIFLWILATNGGALNQLLGAVGIEPIGWLSWPEWVIPAMIIVSLWGFGSQMIIFLAGLQDIPRELYEAVEIDGGGAWHKLIHLTIPLMTPVIYFNLVMGVINSFQVFTPAYIFFGTQGGPLNAGLFYMVNIYNNAFRFFQMGYASALSMILFILIVILSVILVRTSNRWVFYSGGGK